jgi:hypothetical protein
VTRNDDDDDDDDNNNNNNKLTFVNKHVLSATLDCPVTLGEQPFVCKYRLLLELTRICRPAAILGPFVDKHCFTALSLDEELLCVVMGSETVTYLQSNRTAGSHYTVQVGMDTLDC